MITRFCLIFLFGRCNENFSVEQLLNQYNRDLIAIMEEQKEKEGQEQEEDGTHINDILTILPLEQKNEENEENEENENNEKKGNEKKGNEKGNKKGKKEYERENNKKEEEKFLTEEISFSDAEFLQKLLSIKKKNCQIIQRIQ